MGRPKTNWKREKQKPQRFCRQVTRTQKDKKESAKRRMDGDLKERWHIEYLK